MAAEHVLIDLSDGEIVAFQARFGPISEACERHGVPRNALPYVAPDGRLGVPRASVSGTVRALREAAAPQGDGLADLLLTSIRRKLAAAGSGEADASPDPSQRVRAL